MMTEQTVFLSLVKMQCPSCSVVYAVPADFRSRRQNDGKSFFCPNGHSLSYGDTLEKRLQRQLDNMQDQRDAANERARRERERGDRLKASRAAYKAQTTKLKKRAAAGVCPCCNRQFQDLHRHMKNKHPEFVEEHA